MRKLSRYVIGAAALVVISVVGGFLSKALPSIIDPREVAFVAGFVIATILYSGDNK